MDIIELLETEEEIICKILNVDLLIEENDETEIFSFSLPPKYEEL